MTFTIGRLGVAAVNGGEGVALEGPETVSQQGRMVTLTGHVYGDYRAASVWRGWQLLGLAHGEEPVVPVTFADAPEMDGFYRVVSVDCDWALIGSATQETLVPWSISLEQPSAYRLPRIEYPTDYGLRVNSHAIAAYDVCTWVPGPMKAYSPPFTTDGNGTRPVAEGSSVVGIYDLAATSTGASGLGRLVIPPASYYHGSCRIEYDIGSGVYRQAVGRTSFPPSGTLRLTNGVVRCSVTFGSTGTSDLRVEWWDGTVWDTATEFYIEGVSTHDELVYYSAEILRNTAERCTLRLTCEMASINDGVVTVDFSIRRGMRWVYCLPRGVVAPSGGWRLGLTVGVAGTTLTGGVRRTSNNSGGNREILTHPLSSTFDTGNTRVTSASLVKALLGIGCEVGGSAATGQSTAANQIDEFYAALQERAVVTST